MKIKLHEIELGTNDPEKSKAFYQTVLGLGLAVDQNGLKVFDSGVKGLDLNASMHLPAQVVAISFLTDDLQGMISKLNALNISFEGPVTAHLGMTSIQFKDADGYLVKVNAATKESPEWLKAAV